jgi:hypothetical protein
MKRRWLAYVCLILLLSSTAAWADQIILKNGQRYSGKFVRGDANIVEFRILGRTESFKTSEISQILFQEPELAAPTPARETGAGAKGVPAQTQTVGKPQPAADAPAAPKAAIPAGNSTNHPNYNRD